jgi:phosphoribosylformylglycinamidine (FGAM) synthase PurS component
VLIADVDSDEDAYDTQVAAVESALKTYGTSMVEGVSLSSTILITLTSRSLSETNSS